ncbi:MAG: exodeoxyribonuclease V subunit alpha [Idiomarina sp.]|nr:exodeoxyribonuclease V subunit alpha [Idiomarina sp.]
MSELANNETMLVQLQQWQQSGWLGALDVALARMVTTAPLSDAAQTNSSEVIALMTALLSYQVMRGHVCLHLDTLLSDPHELLGLSPRQFAQTETLTQTPADCLAKVTVADIQQAFAASPAVAVVGAAPSSDDLSEPLVYAQGALYLRRFWLYEQRIASQLRGRMKSGAFEAVPGATLNTMLNELFPLEAPTTAATTSAIERVPWQKLACANTLRSRFSVITGGPGTGKTYTVVRLLAMLQRLAMQQGGQALKIRLAAPTGKAAARLKESIQNALDEMRVAPQFAAWQDTFNAISSDSLTLHKLLGTQQHTRAFRYHQGNPLSLDVLVIDEASMVDIEMMDAILAALPKHAQLVLLGDKDQLASVEAGAVLGQLCAGAEAGRYRQQSFDYLQSVSKARLPMQLFDSEGPEYLQHVVMLRVSRRFDGRSGIGHLAHALNTGDLPRISELLKAQDDARLFTDIRLLTPGFRDDDTPLAREQQLLESLRLVCLQGFATYWQTIESRRPAADAQDTEIEHWARDVLKAYAGFQLLSPIRDGVFGVEGLNHQVERWLTFMPKPSQWYEGRPVMVTQNDYSLNLRNGDIGMVLTWPRDGRERVVFVDSEGRLRWILPSRLRQVETVFAMTVHKSQGSEFAHTVMVMPSTDNAVLCRELIYTGVTRAAEQLTMVVPRWQVLEQAVSRQTSRAGNLNL